MTTTFHVPLSERARVRTEAFAIPGALNIALSFAQVGVSLWMLVLASSSSPWIQAAAVLCFTFVMQTGFSLIHEAEHSKLHESRAVNDALGIVMSAIFPGSFTFMKVAHLSHHRKNRSDAELVDYVRAGDKTWIKWVQYYLLIHGLIWVGVPLLSLIIALVPVRLLERGGADRRGVALYLQFVKEARPDRVRLECLFTIGLWWILLEALPISGPGLALCYVGFAFSWASQQYVYHIRTPRHLVEGAYNLRLFTPLRLLYLNFNYHLTHHRAPMVPWIHLPRAAKDAPTRGYLRTYLALWRPPQPVEMAFPQEFQNKGPLPSRDSMGRTMDHDGSDRSISIGS